MTDHIQLSAFHVLVISPFFLYVAFVRGQLMPWVFTVLQVLGLVVLLYHAYRIVTRWKGQGLTVGEYITCSGSGTYTSLYWLYGL